MALRFSKPCLDCGKATTEPSRCEDCAKAAENTRTTERLATEPYRRFYRGKWKKARAQAVARDGNRCQALVNNEQCTATEELTVHHIIPLRDGGDPYELTNLVTLCRPHHEAIENLS